VFLLVYSCVYLIYILYKVSYSGYVQAYHRHMVELSTSEVNPLTSKSFLECKDLGIRLSGTFMGAARNKHRSDISKIVKDGLDYAFVDAPRQLSFLEGAVLHFVSKLPTSDVLDM
jgi:cohesin complex subunit SA-1/2